VGLALLLLAAAIAALLLLRPLAGGSSGPVPAPGVRTERPASPVPAPGFATVDRALARAVGGAANLDGVVEAAAMEDGWSEPAVETSEAGGSAREMRMWSMSKVATMVAVLRQLGWGERPGRPLSAQLEDAFRGAIVRSENCHQRRVVLELERLAGGAEAARAALAAVFRGAGAEATIGRSVEAPESSCLPYLEAQTEIADPLAPALLLGTSTWRIGDAVRLARALARNAYGAALSQRVLSLMRLPKLASREVPPGELTAPLDWGAGRALAGLDPAYKAGWGGTLNGNFLAGQVATVALPDGDHLSLAVMFHPNREPARDDPGITAAPAAIEAVMRAAREAALG
jgi:hypothetical protein